MKITDFCLIFIAITLPIIIVVYINVSFTIKAEEQEMYYQNLINAAIEDATTEMKQVENEDKNIDYGYSGETDKKVSVNAEIGKTAFFNALYNNFGIKGNEAAKRYLQIFVPALVVIDYDGLWVSSIEEYEKDGQTVTEHAVKPKKKFTYTYYILNDKDKDKTYKIVSASEYKFDENVQSAHTVEFTMDDYITHRGQIYNHGKAKETLSERTFYLADTRIGSLVTGDVMVTINNAALYNNSSSEDDFNIKMIEKVVNHLREKKKEVMVETITNEVAYSVNANNFYASSAGVNYDFVFPPMEAEQMGEYINDIGILAFIQGLSIGNRYLDTKAYSVTRLELVNKYYLSVKSNNSKFNMNLYHMSQKCPEYRVSIHEKITPSYVITKQQASSAIAVYGEENNKVKAMGFYPCPICNP